MDRFVAKWQQGDFGNFPAGAGQWQGKNQHDAEKGGNQPAKRGEKTTQNEIKNVQYSTHSRHSALMMAKRHEGEVFISITQKLFYPFFNARVPLLNAGKLVAMLPYGFQAAA